MSNEIDTGKMPVNLVSSTSQKARQAESSKPGATKSEAAIAPVSTPDRVSMTDDAARLQQLEGVLRNSPRVNNVLVAEVSQLIADGKLEINLERIASNLLEMDAGITDPDK